MSEIDLLAKLKQLEEEIENEAPKQAPNPVINRKWAMSMAGGGGRGSYEIGVWRALIEMGVDKDIIAVAGTSSGGLNAALFSLGDYENAQSIWRNIMPRTFLDINDNTVIGPLDTIVNRTLSMGICSRDGLLNILNNDIDCNRFVFAKVPAYVCVAAYDSEDLTDPNNKPTAEYISLSEVTPDIAKKLLLATSAMPYIYPPEHINGKVYRDGGLANLVPIKPLTTVGANALIVVKLEKTNKVPTELYSEFEEVIEINPSRDLGDFIDGTIDFDNRNVLYRMLLGYYDTLRAFSNRMNKNNGIYVSPIDIARKEAEDYEKIMDEIRRDKVISSYNSNMDKLTSMLKKFDI